MATVSITRTYSTGQQLSATNYNDDRTEIVAGVNSINNSQIASDAAISASKISGTAATLTGSETLTNKTLTSPTITTPVLQGNVGGWILGTDTWTYASSTSFTIASADRTGIFTKGTKIKLTQTSDKYFYVTSSSFSTNTTVNITGGSDYTLANAAITTPYYSYDDNPQGFPCVFAYTPTFTGFSVDPSGFYQFSITGGMCYVSVRLNTSGTSNATTFTVSLPVTAAGKTSTAQRFPIAVTDNGSGQAAPGQAIISQGDTTVSLFKDWTGTAWTASGAKAASFSIWYPII